MFNEIFRLELELVETHLRTMLRFEAANTLTELERFSGSLAYSLFSEGKRFRPLLAVLTARALGKPLEQALPLGTAVEMIHTYSLIHDDLPCMDDDDMRRGRPSHHKMYGEAGALLAGDALLTMAFGVLASSPSPRAAMAVAMLSRAAGPVGMVGGQVLDIEASEPTVELLKEIHERKTGRLIRVSVEGAAVLCEASVDQTAALGAYGKELGFAFQLADDLQDFDPDHPEKVNFATSLGVAETLKQLQQAGDRAIDALKPFGENARGLREMIRLNFERV